MDDKGKRPPNPDWRKEFEAIPERDQPVPQITIKEFRRRFTEEHRDALARVKDENHAWLRDQFMKHDDMDYQMAQREAEKIGRKAQEALQLIWMVHPIPYIEVPKASDE